MRPAPDFIIIGAMKCATSTLHDQFARQPGVFMSTPKEPNFFSDDAEYARGHAWYAGLFDAAKPAALRGESSTHYTKRPELDNTIDRMRDAVPDHARFIYLMRHPVSRLVSHYVHAWTQREVSRPLDEVCMSHAGLIDFGRYAYQIEPYLRTFGCGRVLPMFSERLRAEPDASLRRAAAFVGISGEPVWDHGADDQNRSDERLRKDPIRDALLRVPGLRQLRRAIVPSGVRDAAKAMWQMKHKPTLSEVNRRALFERFDADLSRLSTLLGLDLRCETWEKNAQSHDPSWSPAAIAEFGP